MWGQIQNRSPVVVPSNVNAMEEILQSIHSRDIHLDTEEVKTYNKILGDIVSDALTKEMKKDEVFKALFKKINFTGSFYEKLRVKTPDEFDLNLVFQLPKEFQPIKLITDNVMPGFICLKVINTPLLPVTKVQQKVVKFLDAEKFLLRDKVFCWLQSVVDTALRNINWHELLGPTVTVRRSTSGPAVTLNVKYGIDRKEFSVDLVPVFSFTNNNWPGPPIQQLPSYLDSKLLEWFIVPKGPKFEDSRQQWRMSFYMHEKKIMMNYENMKPTIKILKLLRDREDWKGLSSYYIKTLFLWEHKYKEDRPLFWRNSKSYLFYYMLCVLENCLASNYIPFFWHEECNLLQYINSTTTEKWANRIGRIRRHLDHKLSNPEELGSYINCIFRRESQGLFVREDSEEDLIARPQQAFLQEQQQQENLVAGILSGAIAALTVGFVVGSINRQRNERQ